MGAQAAVNPTRFRVLNSRIAAAQSLQHNLPGLAMFGIGTVELLLLGIIPLVIVILVLVRIVRKD
jgi:hypothetical protein